MHLARVLCVAGVVLAVLASAAHAHSWTNCGNDSDHFRIQSITLSPDAPQSGDTVTVVLDGSIDEPITAGMVSLQFLWGHISVAQKDLPLCTGLDAMGVSCPVPPGPFLQKSVFQLPMDIPSGLYTAKLRAVDQNGEEIVCVSTQLAFS